MIIKPELITIKLYTMRKRLFTPLIALTFILSATVSAQKPSNMSAVFGTSGRFEIFAGVSGNRGGVYHTWQTTPNGEWNQAWTSYSPAPDDNPHGLVAGKDGDGRMIVAWIVKGNIHIAAARNTDASLVTSPEPTFRPAGEADGHIYNYTFLAIANNPDGMIEILALNERGRVYSIKEVKQDPAKGFWTFAAPVVNGQKLNQGPILIGGGNLKHISVTKFNGRLALVGTGKDGKVYLKNQTVAGTWDNDPWINLGGNQVQEAYVQESKDHQLEVAALGHDENIYLNYQNVGSSSFNGWQMILDKQQTGPMAPSIFFERFNDGTLFILSHKNAGNTQYVGTFGKTFQAPNNGSWSGTFFSYFAQNGNNSQDFLEFLSPNAFALAADDKGVIHYFSCYRVSPVVEHYIDFSGPSTQRSLAYQQRQFMIPKFPWDHNK